MKRRALVLSAAMWGAAGLAEWATPRRLLAAETPMPPLTSLLPERFAGWEGEDASRLQLVSADVQAVLDVLYQQTLARVYRHRRLGQVMLAAAYGGDQSDATRVHRPEVCYPAQGFAISDVQQERLVLGRGMQQRALPVRRLTARMGSRHEPITYWITVGSRVAATASDQKFIQLRYAVDGVVPDGLLMRISSLERDLPQAWWVHRRFIDDLLSNVLPSHRDRVFGAVAVAPAPASDAAGVQGQPG